MVGAGNLATHLSRALHDAGHEILQVFSRTEENARALAGRLGGGVEYTSSLAGLRDDADIYIVSLKDTALVECAPEICRGREDKLFVHTAGSIPMQVFEGHCSRFGVFYPMQTFSKGREVDFSVIPCFVEACNPDDEQLIHALASSVSRSVYHYTSEQRKYLHLAAVFACNFTNHMYAVCADMLAQHDIPFSTMIPLIDETAAKIHSVEPRKAQTGPAVRFDRNVMDKQLALLKDSPDLQQIYEMLSKSIHKTSTK